MPLVLVTDSTFDNLDVERAILGPLGCQIDSRQCKTPAELIEAVPNADFVITQFAPVNAAVIGAMTKARVIVRYGIGVDNVDVEAATKRGIIVANAPQSNIVAAAEHTVALMLALIVGLLRYVAPGIILPEVPQPISLKVIVPVELSSVVIGSVPAPMVIVFVVEVL